MAVLLPEIQLTVLVVFQMDKVHPGGDEGGLGEEGGVVGASAAVSGVGQAGDLGELVAAHALLPRPDGVVSPPQIQGGKLFAAAGDVFVSLRAEAQPEAVDARVVTASRQAQQAVRFGDTERVFSTEIRVGKAQALPLRAQKAQGQAGVLAVPDGEVAAVHPDLLTAKAQEERRGLGAVTQHKPVPGVEFNNSLCGKRKVEHGSLQKIEMIGKREGHTRAGHRRPLGRDR